jgi:hypothetical protein
MNNFLCPRCNAVLVDENGDHQCEHVAFMYLSLGSDLIFASDGIKALIPEMISEVGDCSEFLQELRDRLGDRLEVHEWEDSPDSFGVNSVRLWIGIWR